MGELYVGGPQLMMGYWRDPELTAAVLRSDVVAGERLYRTGDLVYRDEQGVYFSAGRVDQMVKRSGIRISLTEVVAALVGLEDVSAAVCLPYDGDDQLGIVAFVTTSAPSSSQKLRHALAELLPATMLPDRLEVVDQMPMTSGSKVDERALLAAGRPQPPGSRAQCSEEVVMTKLRWRDDEADAAPQRRNFKPSDAVRLHANEHPYPPPPEVLTAITEGALVVNRYPFGNEGPLTGALARAYGRGNRTGAPRRRLQRAALQVHRRPRRPGHRDRLSPSLLSHLRRRSRDELGHGRAGATSRHRGL